MEIAQNSPLLDMPHAVRTSARASSSGSWLNATGVNNTAPSSLSTSFTATGLYLPFWRDANTMQVHVVDGTPSLLAWQAMLSDAGVAEIVTNGSGPNINGSGRKSRMAFAAGIPVTCYKDATPGASVIGGGFGGSSDNFKSDKWGAVQIVGSDPVNVAIAGLNQQFAAGFYLNSTNIMGRVVTLQGTAAANVAAASTVISGPTVTAMDAIQLKNGQIFLAWVDASSGKCSANVVTTGSSGGSSSLSAGTTVDLATDAVDAGAALNILVKVIPITQTRVGVIYHATGGIPKLVICDISGTTITAGAAVTLGSAITTQSNANTPFDMAVLDPLTQTLMFVYVKNSDSKPYAYPLRVIDKNNVLRGTEFNLSSNTYLCVAIANNPQKNYAGVMLGGGSKLDVMLIKP